MFVCVCVGGGVIKSPRIGKSFLQKPKCQGGMALPNFLFYYWVTNIQKVVYWDSDWNSKSIPVWVQGEEACTKFSLKSLVYGTGKSSITYREGILDKVHSSLPCARHSLIQFKILHRLHFTNSNLARIYPAITPACIRCLHSPATTAHMFWSCPKLQGFWRNIFKSFSDIYIQYIVFLLTLTPS